MDGEPEPEPKAAPPDDRGDAAERRRAVVIALFVALSLATALVLAFFYAQPSGGLG